MIDKTGDVSRATYIGQATVLIETGRHRILTDPIFVRRLIWFIRRQSDPVLKPEQISPIHAILISHGHLDHLSIPCLRRFNRQTPIVAPKGYEKVFLSLSDREIFFIKEWESCEIDGIKISAYPVKHIAGRWPFQRNGTCLAYLIEDCKQIFFIGDTAFFSLTEPYFRNMQHLDLAILPIGAYYPKPWLHYHMNPEQAVDMFKILNARKGLAIHWGTYRTSLERPVEPRIRLKRTIAGTGVEHKFLAVNPGQSISF